MCQPLFKKFGLTINQVGHSMIKYILTSLFIASFGLSRCLSVDLPIIKDVQLSVTMTTNVFQSGSSSVCKTTLLNLSTNTIKIDPTSPDIQVSELGIFLTDDMGKKYSLTPKYSTLWGSHPIMEIKPGDNFMETNAVTFYVTIKPGHYTLNALQIFTLGGMYCVTEPGHIKVHIIK